MSRKISASLNDCGTIKENDDTIDDSIIELKNKQGLTLFTCALFIMAEMAGSGILALPKAVSEAGWTGFALLMLSCFFSLYCGITLGNCWMMIRAKNERYKEHVNDPYPIIGLEAGGKLGKIVVEFCVLVTLLGVVIVFLLLSSQQISSLIDTPIGSFDQKNEFRLWILIIGFVLLPFTWLGTPKDIWPFAMGACLCTILACVFICVRTIMYICENGISEKSTEDTATLKSLFSAFGTIAFAFGGASVFPTFQADMRKPSQFKYSASFAYIGVLLLYIPVTILPYLAFGKDVDSDVLRTLKSLDGNGKVFVTMSEALISFHLLFTFVITINPIAQQIEEYFKAPHSFGWKRITIRTSIVLFVIAVAEAIPNFGPILSFVGGSTITMMAFILPCIFYIKLKSKVTLTIKVAHAEIIVVALLFGAAAVYTSIEHFQNPFKS